MSDASHLEAHAGIYRLLINGIFNSYTLKRDFDLKAQYLEYKFQNDYNALIDLDGK